MEFIQKKWVNVPDPSNPPAIPEGQSALAALDANNMNRMEQGIKDLYSNGVPIFERDVLKNINKHYWKRQGTGSIEISTADSTVEIYYDPTDGSDPTAEDTERTLYYSDSASVVAGRATLDNPTAVTYDWSTSNRDNVEVLNGKYWSKASDGSEPVYYSSSIDKACTSGSDKTKKMTVKGNVVTALITGGVDFVFSTSPETYPHNGTSGNYLYEYKGIIEENILYGNRVETGSYIGTGLYWENSSYETTLTFSFVPKIVFIICPISTYLSTYAEVLRVFIHGQTQAGIRGDNGSTNSRERLYVSWENNTMKLSAWGSSDNPSVQCNSLGTEYTYIAFS